MQDTNDHRIFRPKKLTTQDIRDGCVYITNGDETETRVCVVNEELRQGIDFMSHAEKSVTFLGSAVLKPNHPDYQRAYRLAKRVAEEGYAVVTGGGPGIMEAANKGAHDVGGKSIGFTIQLPHEQNTNLYVTDDVPFYYFFTRKVALFYAAEAYVYFAGGFGTYDELFEMLTLIQTKKIANVPIILVGKDFWQPLDAVIRTTMLEKYATIQEDDIAIYTITDDEDEVMQIIRGAQLRKGD